MRYLTTVAALLFSGLASAVTIQAEWEWPTTRINGAALPLSEIQSINAQYGACSADNTALASVEGGWTFAPPVTTATFESSPGNRCLLAWVVDSDAQESERVLVTFAVPDRPPPSVPVLIVFRALPDPVPTLTLSADPLSVTVGGSSVLSWSSTDATSCTALDGWSGSRATSGSEATAALSGTTSYTLECAGYGGTVSQTVTVEAIPLPPANMETYSKAGYQTTAVQMVVNGAKVKAPGANTVKVGVPCDCSTYDITDTSNMRWCSVGGQLQSAYNTALGGIPRGEAFPDNYVATCKEKQP